MTEFLHSGSAQAHETLKGRIPEGLLDILRIPGLGVRKVRALYDGAGIESVEDLERACRDGRLDRLGGFGAKTRTTSSPRSPACASSDIAGCCRMHRPRPMNCSKSLRALPATRRAAIAGSLRRCRETVRDIDIVAGSDDPAAVSAAFAGHRAVREVVARGDTRTSVRLHSGIQADLRIVSDDGFPALLHHFTGSRDHNVAMRSRALGRGMRLNEYGLFDRSGEAVPCAAEADLFAALGLSFIPPELREGLGRSKLPPKGPCPSSSGPKTFAASCTCTPRTATAGTPSPRWPPRSGGAAIPVSASATTASPPGTFSDSSRKMWPNSTGRSMR